MNRSLQVHVMKRGSWNLEVLKRLESKFLYFSNDLEPEKKLGRKDEMLVRTKKRHFLVNKLHLINNLAIFNELRMVELILES